MEHDDIDHTRNVSEFIYNPLEQPVCGVIIIVHISIPQYLLMRYFGYYR